METGNKPFISVIVPVYNASNHLAQCLESILGQTYTALQVICVNDQSTDSSLEILRSYAERDSRITVLTKQNEGVSFARNYGLSKADGDYILFVDSDDWIELDTCEIAVKHALEGNYDVVMWSYMRERQGESLAKRIYDEDVVFENVSDVRSKLHRRMVGILDAELSRPEGADALCTVWGKLYKTQIIKEQNIKFYDIREIGTYEDGLFNLDFFGYAESALFLNQNLYHYRRTENSSLTTAYNPKLREQWSKLFQIMRTYIANHQLGKEYSQALNNRIALSIIPLGINIVSSPAGIKSKLAEIKQTITDEAYVAAIGTLIMRYFPVHWRVFFYFARSKNACGIYLLLMGIQKIRGK